MPGAAVSQRHRASFQVDAISRQTDGKALRMFPARSLALLMNGIILLIFKA